MSQREKSYEESSIVEFPVSESQAENSMAMLKEITGKLLDHDSEESKGYLAMYNHCLTASVECLDRNNKILINRDINDSGKRYIVEQNEALLREMRDVRKSIQTHQTVKYLIVASTVVCSILIIAKYAK